MYSSEDIIEPSDASLIVFTCLKRSTSPSLGGKCCMIGGAGWWVKIWQEQIREKTKEGKGMLFENKRKTIHAGGKTKA